MNDFLSNMQSLVLYQQVYKRNNSNDKEDDIKLEMVKFKKAISKSAFGNVKIATNHYKDDFSIDKINLPSINTDTSTKDILSYENSLKTLMGTTSPKINVDIKTNVVSKGSGSLNSNYSSTFSFSSGNSIPNISQFGLIKMTGTEGKNKNGYTIGKGAKQRAAASLNYITRDEKGKPISDLKDKNGNVVDKTMLKEQIENIKAERRLVLSPNPRLELSNEDIGKVVRETMNSYSKSFAREFNYFYAIHHNTSTPHAHILMTSNHGDGDGIKMYKDELFELKMIFEDSLKELAKDNKININDTSILPTAKQIGNFIGAIPNATLFNQNKFLAHKIAKKFDLEFDSKQVGENPEKLQEWFLKNDKFFKEYFMNATNKDAFLFQDYIKVSQDLSNRYDLGLTKDTTSNIKEFKNWLHEKQEIFLAHRISEDKNLILQKEGASSKNKVYKWFKENETDVKEWNEEYKHFPSKQMSFLAQKYSKMVDIKPDKILTSRKEAREFVRSYTKNPLLYAGNSRKSLHTVLGAKKEQYKDEFLKEHITEKSFNTELERLNALQKRLAQGQEVTEGSLKRYNLDTSVYLTDSKIIHLDGIKLDEKTKEVLNKKINSHVENLTKENTDEYNKNYIKKASALNYIISKSDNISISALENIGLNKEKDLQDFKIEKIDTELKIINFKNTDLNRDVEEIKRNEDLNKQKPLSHQIQNVLQTNKQKTFIDVNTIKNTQIDKFIDNNIKEDSLNKFEQISTFIAQNKDINSSNVDEYNTLLTYAIDNKNIELMDSLYALDTQTKNDNSLLELKFLFYSEALNITRDDVYEKMLEKYFELGSEEIKNIENIEKTFDNYFELFNLKDDSNLLDEDVKHKFYIENLTEFVIEKYNEVQWQHFNMDNENIDEKDIQLYFETTQKLTEEGNLLNEYISNTLEIKSLENTIEESLLNGNFKIMQELLQDERLSTNTRLNFQYMYESMLCDEHILDEVYEKVIDKAELDEKVYETFKEDDFLNDMKKIDLEDELIEEKIEEKTQEHELTLGGQ